MLHKILRWLSNELLVPVGRVVARTPITANFVTVLGLVMVAVACYYIADGQTFLGGWILLAGALLDTLDGPIAKARGTAGPRGAFLDSTLDRIADGLIFGSIAYHLASLGERGGLGLSLACLVLGFVTSYIKARAESLGWTASVGIAERAPRVAIVLVGLLFGVLIPAITVLAAMAFLTVIQRFAFVWKQARSGAVK